MTDDSGGMLCARSVQSFVEKKSPDAGDFFVSVPAGFIAGTSFVAWDSLVRYWVSRFQRAFGARAPDTLSGMKAYPENPFGGRWPERFYSPSMAQKT